MIPDSVKAVKSKDHVPSKRVAIFVPVHSNILAAKLIDRHIVGWG